MKPFLPHFLAACTLALASSCVLAQDGSSADELIQAGLSSLKQIDESRSGELWDSASAFVKTRFPKAEFVANTQRSRQTVGVVARRDWASVTRIRYLDDSAGIPPGLYANVDFATRLTNDKTVFEKVSFRLEPNGWRLTGYVPRENQ
ncbi:DUF4019 domain-containing protein [Acidovorax cavernicola]|uniref:DUF4019 domain-containing protein n=1 Tax=Acidovorax cavernicola TaxID=1675792 RepID=A0A9X8GT73_9BURK|nr:DUF4019 domain-containing protein [Acidovorax cavernicola]RIX75992.1 DUF4019 domain-containing protein [Acidovorax cavernicola]